jgi:hypothetical protein
MFESRYEDELFMAEQLLSRGGALSPEDHVWLGKLMSAYEASCDAVDVAAPELPDPWAVDTQADIFEAALAEASPDRSIEPSTATGSDTG